MDPPLGLAESVRGAYFEVSRTPQDEKRRQKEQLREEPKPPAIIQPCAFGQIPFLSFDDIPLGKTSSRTLIIRNPSQKPLHVHFEKVPKAEKGFDFNHDDFDLDGKSQALLEIGWTPQNGTPLRETVIVKLGTLKSQVNLIATCKCPPPPKGQKKLGPPRRTPAVPAQPPGIRFQPQKFFGPPVLSAIPDDVLDVNLKRQTFVPIKGTMPQIQLPIISTPISDREEKMRSKENSAQVQPLTPVRGRSGQPLRNSNFVFNEAKLNSMSQMESQNKKSVIVPVQSNFAEEETRESRDDGKNSENVQTITPLGDVLVQESAKKDNAINANAKEAVTVADQCRSNTFTKVQCGGATFKVPNTVENRERATTQLESFPSPTAAEFEPAFNFSLELSRLDLSLSPSDKSHRKSNQATKPVEEKMPIEEATMSCVTANCEDRRISSGTYVLKSPDVADLRDVASPICGAQQQTVRKEIVEMSGISAFAEPTPNCYLTPSAGQLDGEQADESVDEISLIIANQMRLSRGEKPLPLPPKKEVYNGVPSPVVDFRKTNPRTNFLHNSISEASFLPPSPHDPFKCSTAVKEKARDETMVSDFEHSSEIRRELFGSNSVDTCIEVAKRFTFDSIVIPPLSPTPPANENRFSSETFIKTPEIPQLDTIQEEAEDSSQKENTRNRTYDKDKTWDFTLNANSIVANLSPPHVVDEVPHRETPKATTNSVPMEIPPPATNVPQEMQPKPRSIAICISPPKKATSASAASRETLVSSHMNPPMSYTRRSIAASSIATKTTRDAPSNQQIASESAPRQTSRLSRGESRPTASQEVNGASKVATKPTASKEVNGATKMATKPTASKEVNGATKMATKPTASKEVNGATKMAAKPIEASSSASNPSNERPSLGAIPKIPKPTNRNVEEMKTRMESSGPTTKSGAFFIPLADAEEEEDAESKDVQTKKQEIPPRRSLAPERRQTSAVVRKQAASCRPAVKVPTTRLTLLKPVKSGPNLIHHPNPFAAKNMYYDERWIEKQENGFKKWLNFILTPPDGFECSENNNLLLAPGKLDVAKLWSACTRDCRVPRAPTREVLSMRAYSARRQLKQLRRDAFTLWQSPTFAPVIIKIETEIEKQRLAIRADRQLNKDVGIKKNILLLLLNYNPLWLHIGLETVFGEILPVSKLSDIVGISQFILTRLLSNPDILAKFSHPTVPNHYLPGHESALRQFTLKKFLQLVYFLDQAKALRIIKHNPCLFCKDSPIKASRDLLNSFSRDFLAGEGDVNKHLGYLGFKVSHQQTPLDEFDYAVTKIAVDLRCGVRLCRVMEILTNDLSLTTKLRMPAVSRLQKIHNVDVALASLKVTNAGLPDEISARDIVDGHMEKTLGLLWHIIFGFQVDQILNVERLQKELAFLEKSLQYRVRMEDEDAKLGFNFILDCNRRAIKENAQAATNDWNLSEKMQLLLKWARLVCAHYNIEIENFSVSFSDGRALCYLIHHYYPTYLKREDIKDETSQNQKRVENLDKSLNDSLTYNYGNSGTFDPKLFERCLVNERENFKLLSQKLTELGGVPMIIQSAEMSNTIPDQKVTATFVAYMSARLIDLSVEMSAARTIQLAWKHHIATKRERELKVANSAAVVIQRMVRKFLRRRQMAKYNEAAIRIQAAFRGYQARKHVFRIREEIRLQHLSQSVIIIQKYWRRHLAIQLCKRRMKSIILIQSIVRMRRERTKYLQQRHLIKANAASICIQKYWRCLKARKLLKSMIEEKAQRMNLAAVTLQKHWKGHFQLQLYSRLKVATIKIQSHVRRVQARERFLTLKKSAILIQARTRGYFGKKRYEKTLKDVIIIQSLFRRFLSKKLVNQMRIEKAAAIEIQSVWRGYRQRQKYKALLHAREALRQSSALTIQKNWKRFVAKEKYQKERHSVIKVQAMVRKMLAMKSFRRQRQAAICIQKRWRGYITKRNYNAMLMARQAAATIIQKNWQAYTAKREYQNVLKSVIKAQAVSRRWLAMKEYKQKRDVVIVMQKYARRFIAVRNYKAELAARENRRQAAALIIQKTWRALTAVRRYKSTRSSIILVQALVRKRLAMTALTRKRNAAIVIQKYWRGFIEKKKYRTTLLLRQAASIKIQKTWKMFVARKKYQQTCRSVVLVQSFIRRRLAVNAYTKKKQAAICLQTHWRGYIAKKNYNIALREREEHRQASSIIIQKTWKMFVARKKYQQTCRSVVLVQSLIRRRLAVNTYTKKKQAAICLQTHWRGYIAKRNYRIALREREERRQASSIIIQKTWKMFVARKKYQQTLRSVVLVQSLIRRRLAVNAFTKKKQAAICLQSHWRGYVAKRNYSATIMAAVTIQKNWKAYQARKYYQSLLHSVIQMQSLLRMKLALREFQSTKRAINVIQTYWRGYHARKQYLALLHLRQSSATTIQKNWRAFHARKRFEMTRQKVILIQALFRSRRDQKNFQLARQSAIKIQSCWRGFVARKEFCCCLKDIVQVQALVRRFLANRRVSKIRQLLFEQQTKSAITLQSYWKMYLAQKKYQTIQKQRLEASIKIQTIWRSFVAKRKLKELFSERKELCRASATIIQKNWRAFAEKRKYKSTLLKIVLVQSQIRMHLASLKFRQMKASAVVIQAHWRGFVLRRKYLETRSSVVLLQSHIRRILAQKRVAEIRHQNLVIKQTQASIAIQSWWRRMQAKTRVKLMRQSKAAVKIQARWKGYSERQKYFATLQARLGLKNASAIIIQKNWKAAKARRTFLDLRTNVIRVQSLVRMRLAVGRFQTLRQSVILIQSHWRGYSARKKYQEQINCIVKIQAYIRRFLAQKAFSRQQQEHILATKTKAAQTIQRSWRLWSSSQKLRQILFQRNVSAIVIQKNWKAFAEKRKFQELSRHAVKIQATIRMIQTRRRFVAMKKSAILIQANWRRYLARKSYLITIGRIVKLQSYWRRFLARKKVDSIRESKRMLSLQISSARIIQKNWKIFLMRKKLSELVNKEKRVKRNAANTIQALWRGYSYRKKLKAELGRKLDEVRQKVDEANRNATEAKKLCNRTAIALDYLYKSKDMSHLIKALTDLDVSTHYSTNCCVQMSSDECRSIKILADLIQRCNRSVPHIEVISTTLEIFLNLAECEETRNLMSGMPEIFESVISCMAKNENTPKVFCKGCSVLWKLTHKPEGVQILCQPAHAKKLRDFETRQCGKPQIGGGANRQRSASDVSKIKVLSLKHCGHLGKRVVRYHDNPSTAIKVLNNKIKSQVQRFKS